MTESELYAAAKALVSREIGDCPVDCSENESCFLYNGKYVKICPSVYIDENDMPCFAVQRYYSQQTCDISVFSLKNRLSWDFYIVKSSVIDSCFGRLDNISLPLIEPFSLHTKVGGIKQAIDLACSL